MHGSTEGGYKGYPHDLEKEDVLNARNFSSMILGEELEGFD